MPGNFGGVTFNPNAFLEGAQAAKAFEQLRAQNMAASHFNAADTSQSQADLNKAGLYDQANALADRPLEQQKQQLAVQTAQQTLQHNQTADADAQQKAEWAKVATVTDALSRVPPEHQAAAFKQMRPLLQSSLGLDPAHADAIEQQLATNPDFLTALHEKALGVAGNTVYNKDTGEVVIDGTSKSAAPKPTIVHDAQGVPWQVITDASGKPHLEAIPVGAPDGGAAPAASVSGPGYTEDTFAQALQQAAPGAVVTSGYRTPEHNHAVGGVDNSNHTLNGGQAADIAPGTSGMSMEQLGQLWQGKGLHTLYEHGPKIVTDPRQADHVHVDFPQTAASAAAPAASGPHFATKTEVAGSRSSAAVDPEYATFLADQVMNGGKDFLPTGNGPAGQAARQAVIMAGKAKYGDKFDLVSSTAGYKADQLSLAANTKQTDMSTGYEKAAEAASSLIRLNGHDLGLTGRGPMIDGPLLEWKIASGDPTVTTYKNYVDSFANEYAKIISGATGASGSTDAANREAHSRLNAGMAQGQLQSVLDGMEKEMQAKLDAQRGNLDTIRGRIGNGTQSTGEVNLDDLWKKHGGK